MKTKLYFEYLELLIGNWLFDCGVLNVYYKKRRKFEVLCKIFTFILGTSTFVPHDPSKDDQTVFISNLSFDIEEDKVREVLNPVGKIEEIRFVRDFKGQFKGYGFVVFSSHVRDFKYLLY